MSLESYETPIDWVPDDTIVNSFTDPQWLGWQLGVNRLAELALWTFLPVVDTPDPIDDLGDFKLITVDEDIPKYGYVRTVLPSLSILDVETQFHLQAEAIAADIVDGFRSS